VKLNYFYTFLMLSRSNMRNRAKCKLCSSIIESYHSTDYVECKCGEIGVFGGESLKCSAKNWDNFLRIDDADKLVAITVKSSAEQQPGHESAENDADNNASNHINHKHSRKELLDMLRELIKNIEQLPAQAMTTPINHYDFNSLLILLFALFNDDCSSDS
jgi:hypothetical protein